MRLPSALGTSLIGLALSTVMAHAQAGLQLPGQPPLSAQQMMGLPGAAAAAAEAASKAKPSDTYDAAAFNKAVSIRNGSQGSQQAAAPMQPPSRPGGLSDPLAAITPVTIPYQPATPGVEADLGIRFPDRLRPQVLASRGDDAFSVALEARGVPCRLDAAPSHARLGATQSRINAYVSSSLPKGPARTWMDVPGRSFASGGRLGALYWPDPARSPYAAYAAETPRTRVFMVCQVKGAPDRAAMASIIRDLRIP